jgi:hypothetical protein
MNTKRFQKRFRVYLRKFGRKMAKNMAGKSEPLNEIQSYAFSITRKLIVHRDSELLYAPISRTCYVENANYFVRFSDNAVTITNGKFSYYVWLPSNITDQIREVFYRTLENRKTNIEIRYDQKTIENLKQIQSEIESK